MIDDHHEHGHICMSRSKLRYPAVYIHDQGLQISNEPPFRQNFMHRFRNEFQLIIGHTLVVK